MCFLGKIVFKVVGFSRPGVLLIIDWLETWNRIDGVGAWDDRGETLGSS